MHVLSKEAEHALGGWYGNAPGRHVPPGADTYGRNACMPRGTRSYVDSRSISGLNQAGVYV